jgi:hypothetical protein
MHVLSLPVNTKLVTRPVLTLPEIHGYPHKREYSMHAVAWTLADLRGHERPQCNEVAAALLFRDRRAA